MLHDLNKRACEAFLTGDYMTSLWMFESMERLLDELSKQDDSQPHTFECLEEKARCVFNQAACLYRLGAIENAMLRSRKATDLYEDTYDASPMEVSLRDCIYPPLYRQIELLKMGGAEVSCHIID